MSETLETAIMFCLFETRPLIADDIWQEFAAMPPEDLCLCHFGLGLYLRNNVLKPDSTLYKLFVCDGVAHKDDMSAYMLGCWHACLNNTESPCQITGRAKKYVNKGGSYESNRDSTESRQSGQNYATDVNPQGTLHIQARRIGDFHDT